MKFVMKYQTVMGNIISLLIAAANVIAISFVILLSTNNALGL